MDSKMQHAAGIPETALNSSAHIGARAQVETFVTFQREIDWKRPRNARIKPARDTGFVTLLRQRLWLQQSTTL